MQFNQREILAVTNPEYYTCINWKPLGDRQRFEYPNKQEAIQKGNMAARLAGPAGDQAEAGAAVQGASQGIQIMNMQGNFTLEDASIVKIVQGMASAVPGGGSTTVNNQTVQSSGSMQIRAGNASTLAKKSYLNRRGF